LGIKKTLGLILTHINAADSFEQAAKNISGRLGVTLILRERSYPRHMKNDFPDSLYHDFKRGCILVEQRFCDTPADAILCTAETGFLIINPEQSVIIISGKKGGEFFSSHFYIIMLNIISRLQNRTGCDAQYPTEFRLCRTITPVAPGSNKTGMCHPARCAGVFKYHKNRYNLIFCSPRTLGKWCKLA